MVIGMPMLAWLPQFHSKFAMIGIFQELKGGYCNAVSHVPTPDARTGRSAMSS